MRKTIIFGLIVLLARDTRAQQCDIAQTGVKIYNADNRDPVSAIFVGETANFRFTIQNSKSALDCAVPANSVKAVFDFPTSLGGIRSYVYAGAPVFVYDYFTWTYNSAADVLIGINNRAIPAGVADILSVRVRGNTAGAGNSNLNMTQEKGIVDNVSNNFSGARLTVKGAGIPMIRLTSFSVTPDRCDVAVNWSTLAEQGLDRFELEFSTDGFSFNKIATVQAKNNLGGASYELKIKAPAEKGFYRLRQVENDSRVSYSEDQHASASCGFKGVITMYPNPVRGNQKLTVNISGYSGKVGADLFDGVGKKIMTYNLAANVNQLSVSNLAAGTYMLYVRDEDGGVQSFKVIVLN